MSQKTRGDRAITIGQLQVLELVSRGYIAKEIAYKINRTENWVNHTMGSIKAKLKAKTNVEAVANAFRQGILK